MSSTTKIPKKTAQKWWWKIQRKGLGSSGSKVFEFDPGLLWSLGMSIGMWRIQRKNSSTLNDSRSGQTFTVHRSGKPIWLFSKDRHRWRVTEFGDIDGMSNRRLMDRITQILSRLCLNMWICLNHGMSSLIFETDTSHHCTTHTYQHMFKLAFIQRLCQRHVFIWIHFKQTKLIDCENYHHELCASSKNGQTSGLSGPEEGRRGAQKTAPPGPTSHTVKLMFLYSTLSTLKPAGLLLDCLG